MGLIWNGQPHCKRCGIELDEIPEVCPACGFHPRDKGLKITLYIMIGVVALVGVAFALMNTAPQMAAYLILTAGVGFLVSVVLLLVSFTANPYRLGGIFR